MEKITTILNNNSKRKFMTILNLKIITLIFFAISVLTLESVQFVNNNWGF